MIDIAETIETAANLFVRRTSDAVMACALAAGVEPDETKLLVGSCLEPLDMPAIMKIFFGLGVLAQQRAHVVRPN